MKIKLFVLALTASLALTGCTGHQHRKYTITRFDPQTGNKVVQFDDNSTATAAFGSPKLDNHSGTTLVADAMTPYQQQVVITQPQPAAAQPAPAPACAAPPVSQVIPAVPTASYVVANPPPVIYQRSPIVAGYAHADINIGRRGYYDDCWDRDRYMAHGIVNYGGYYGHRPPPWQANPAFHDPCTPHWGGTPGRRPGYRY